MEKQCCACWRAGAAQGRCDNVRDRQGMAGGRAGEVACGSSAAVRAMAGVVCGDGSGSAWPVCKMPCVNRQMQDVSVAKTERDGRERREVRR